MFRILLKKQIFEVFRSYFYDAKKNRMRSKGAIAVWIIFFCFMMVGFLGGMFTALSMTLCGALTGAGLGWMYFLILSGIAILLGAFGSVFNTYAGLYLGKDNDLLLSMPIPVKTIIAARLTNVYIMGTMYSSTALLPMLIVYQVVAGPSLPAAVCGLALYIIVTLIVLMLSCLLGRVVAKISLKLKNKSFITVLISLVFIAVYYFFYFKARIIIEDIVNNAEEYGSKIKGAAYGLYLFGRIGEGDPAVTAIFFAATAALLALLMYVLTRSFLSIATDTGNTAKARYVEKKARKRSAFGALLGKEFARFTSSPNYMLNCGLGVLLIPAAGIALLIKGQSLVEMAGDILPELPDLAAVIVCTALCLFTTMNDTTAPSVSLEGKSIWIPQSLPVSAKTVLRAKAAMQIIITSIPLLFASVCAAIVIPSSAAVKIMLCVMPQVFSLFMALFGSVVGISMPILNWTNETAPIKQSGAVTLVLFAGWGISAVPGGLYLLAGRVLGAAVYMLIWTVIFAAVSAVLLRRLDTKGAAYFAALQ